MSKDLPAKPLTFWQRITKAFAKQVDKPERPAHGADWERAQGARNPYPAKISMAAFASHSYVYAAVSRASQDLAALPIKLIKGKGERSEIIEEHPFLDLMEQPSTYVDGFSFREQLVVDLMLTGGCYALLAGSTDIPASVFRLHPEQTKIVTDPIMGIKGFEFSDSGNVVEYPVDRVVYTQLASWGDGVNALYGLGGIQPLQREIGADISAQKLASDAAKKGRPDILISPADEADIWDYEQRRAILDAYKGMSGEGGAMVLSGQVKLSLYRYPRAILSFKRCATIPAKRSARFLVFLLQCLVITAQTLRYQGNKRKTIGKYKPSAARESDTSSHRLQSGLIRIYALKSIIQALRPCKIYAMHS